MNPAQPRTPPRQERARKTLDRILTAAEDLLEGTLFEQLTIAEVAEKAGVAVGTVYTRFKTKDDLLPALFDRHNDRVRNEVEALFGALAKDQTLAERARRVARFSVRYHVRNRGLLRALTHYVQANPTSVPAATIQTRNAQYAAVAGAIVGDAPRSIAQDAVFAMRVINAVCRDQLLFAEVSAGSSRQDSPARLERQLERLLISFLPDQTKPGA